MKKDKDIISKNFKYDVRLIETSLRDGHLDDKEYEKFLKSLPDESSNVNYIDIFEDKHETAESVEDNRLTFTSV